MDSFDCSIKIDMSNYSLKKYCFHIYLMHSYIEHNNLITVSLPLKYMLHYTLYFIDQMQRSSQICEHHQERSHEGYQWFTLLQLIFYFFVYFMIIVHIMFHDNRVIYFPFFSSFKISTIDVFVINKLTFNNFFFAILHKITFVLTNISIFALSQL